MNIDLVTNSEEIESLSKFLKLHNIDAHDVEISNINWYLIARDNNRILGYCNFYMVASDAEIIDVLVQENSRGKGIGAALFEHLISLFKQNGIKRVVLEVRVDNFSAINLYKRFGFTKFNVREKYYNGVDAICMELVLNGK